LVGFHTPLSCCFYFRYLSPYWNFFLFILCSLSLLISESICVLSSHVFPKCHQIISSTLFGLFVSWFWSKYLFWICCVFDLLVPFIFSLSSYLCLDLHKFLFINSIVFVFWYLAVFSSFYRIPCLHNSVLAVLFKKIIFLHRKFLILWIMQDWGVTEKTKKKKNQLKRVNRKKMINIIKTVCKSGCYSWRNWTLILKTLLKKNGSCVWSETNARF